MSESPPQKDMVILTADKNAQFAMRGVLTRHRALGIRQGIEVDYVIHPEKDPGVLRHPEEMVRTYVRSHAYALIVMDREGSGDESQTATEMEEQIQEKLRGIGWGDRAAAVVIDPELEIWVWSNSPHVQTELGWHGRQPDLHTWLHNNGFLAGTSAKPSRPKEAMEAALRVARKPRSSAIYKALAEQVGLAKCTDRSFTKLKRTLGNWFSDV